MHDETKSEIIRSRLLLLQQLQDAQRRAATAEDEAMRWRILAGAIGGLAGLASLACAIVGR
jgi:hypothetical protein